MASVRAAMSLSTSSSSLRVLEFEPNAILYVGHPGDEERVLNFLAASAIAGTVPPYDFLGDIVRRAGVKTTDRRPLAIQKLRPFGSETLSAVHRRLVSFSRSQGLCAGWMLLPMIDTTPPAGSSMPPPPPGPAGQGGTAQTAEMDLRSQLRRHLGIESQNGHGASTDRERKGG